MNKLLNKSLRRFTVYAGFVLACSIPVYYIAISKLWQYELDEHNIILTPEAGREDTFLFIGAITLLTVFFFVLILGGFVLLNRKISRRLWQPFYQTLEKIKSFDLNSNTTVKFEPGNIIEFEELNASINKLLERNIATFRQQKEFTENASHELQTPLAIVQSKMDLLLQDGALTSAQSQIIEETNNALSRVSRINKNLLLLAKIENQQFLEKQQVNMSEPLQEILDLLSGLLEDRSIESNISPNCIVEGNRILVEVMLTNLLMNSLRHTESGIKIELSLSPVELVISNPGNYPLDGSKLFRRFSAASSQTPGSGLGLSIVKEICSRYNWDVGYSFADGRHVFSIRF
ncbi:MAG TPA: histidine kinase dimerization/phospho-acceptor domain-containing protein [Pedobacter sp.]|uniref:sensor histidine kinase n=1 Tax=Pedobacter sp. TaxID=1411316 RepID=UPI002C458F0D|nr:histidine kinase dimerization/phospho-acceptor domain-containing protein [Pedobacter sp.]HMI01908.1 histidine kinase dimerization/phospho-acceptor domain-containing protein [Pedobacter sp.]